MFERYIQQLNKKVPFSAEETELITSHLILKKIRKRQYLLQAGEVCRFVAFVEKGVVRQYTVNNKGSEHIIQFGVEGWTVSDLYSFMTAEPAIYHIDAVEDSELVLVTKAAQDEIMRQVPRYETYLRMQFMGAYLALQKRVSNMISLPPYERYLAFTRLYPTIAQRVPQHMIASYLGLTPETLSRIRRKLGMQK